MATIATLQHNTAVRRPVPIEKAVLPIEWLSVGPGQGEGPKLVRFGNTAFCLEWWIIGIAQKRVIILRLTKRYLTL
jgi:hypothetical protein